MLEYHCNVCIYVKRQWLNNILTKWTSWQCLGIDGDDGGESRGGGSWSTEFDRLTKISRWSCGQNLLWRQNRLAGKKDLDDLAFKISCEDKTALSWTPVVWGRRRRPGMWSLLRERRPTLRTWSLRMRVRLWMRWGWGCGCNNRPKYQQTLPCNGLKVGTYCKSEVSNTNLQRIEGRLRLDGDGESTSSTVSVTIRSLWTETLEQKKNTKERKNILFRRIHLIEDMVAALREIVAW